MTSKLEKDVRFLKVYAALVTILLGVLAFSAFMRGNQKFEEIDVERINIVEKDGKLKMVISNSGRQHPGVIDGKTIERKRSAGMIFFNDRGDECGGLAFEGDLKDGKSAASGSLTFDKFRNDQTVGIQHLEGDNGQYAAGLRVWDRPNTSIGPMIDKFNAIEKMSDGPARTAALKELSEMPSGAERVIVGRDRQGVALVRLCDANGKTRARLSVDAAGSSKLEFLDESGKVTFSLPQDSKNDKK